MEKKDLQITNKYKKRSFLTCCCSCLSVKLITAQKLQIIDCKEKISKEIDNKTLVATEEKNEEKLRENTQKPNEEIIRNILTEYLALKRAERLKTKLPVLSDPPGFKSTKKINPYDALKIEYCSENNPLCDNYKQSVSRAFLVPCKSKSAPTTSIAHDSFTDIYEKIHRFKESTRNVTSKKLELIFKRSSYNRESNSNSSVQHKISFDRRSSQNYSSIQDSRRLSTEGKRKKSRQIVKQIFLNPSIEGEFSKNKNSSSSLKWKLIISQHDQNKGDFL